MKRLIFPAILALFSLVSPASAQDVFAPRGVPVAPPEGVRQLALSPADRLMIHELLEFIVATVKDESGNPKYKMPSVEPVLIRFSVYAMGELSCPSNPYTPQCRVLGTHLTGSYVVFVLGALMPDDLKHVALHELNHYLQSRKNPNIGSCADDYADEREAYITQQKYRSLVQGYTGPMLPIPSPCIDDETHN